MTAPAGAKPIVTPMPSVSNADADAAAAAGPGSPEAEALAAAEAAAAAAKPDEGKPATDDTKPDADAAKPDADVSLELDAPADKPKAEVTVEETGVEAFDSVGKMLAEKGVENAQEILDGFVETGEVSLEHKAAMIEALGEGVASMAFKQLEDTANAMIAEAKKDTNEALDYANQLFNGEDPQTTWGQIKEYIRTPEAGFSEADIATMNSMLAQGGLAAKLVFDKIHAVYTKDANNSVPGQLLEGDAGVTGGTFEPISRLDYTFQMRKAVNEYGEDSFQVKELNRRRTLTMRQGG